MQPYERLLDVLGPLDGLLVGYSGGVDSALLAYAATQVHGGRAIAVTAVSPSLARAERRAAQAFAREHGIAHLEIATDEADRPEYVRNDGNRCFHCKSAFFEALAPAAALLGRPVALGTVRDDLGEHRPGLAAARQHDALMPLVTAGFDKATVRAVSAALGLGTAGKPAQPCLASRVAYGDEVTPELLARVDAAEQGLRELGFAVVRVRAHAAGTLARVEVPGDRIEELAARRGEVDRILRAAGFTFAALDLAGFASGGLNRLLPVVRR